MFRFVNRKEAATCLKIGYTTLKKYRYEGIWIEGIHWVKLNSRCVRYNLDLLQDWYHNQNDAAAHQRAIDRYQATLPSNQPLPTRRKSI
jgi:hypothetical protein